MTLRTSSIFCSVVLDDLPGRSSSSTVPVAQKQSNVSLMQASVAVFLPNSIYNLRLATTGGSNLAVNTTIFILRLIVTGIYLKVDTIKFKRIYYYFVKRNKLIACIVYEILMYTFHTDFWDTLYIRTFIYALFALCAYHTPRITQE